MSLPLPQHATRDLPQYRVPGTQAVKVEAYLRETFGLPALRYVCCGWSNGAPYYWREGAEAVRYQRYGRGIAAARAERMASHRGIQRNG